MACDGVKGMLWRAYYSHNVLSELKVRGQTKRTCTACAVHGLPCRSCSIFKYNGELGPGFLYGKRYLFSDDTIVLSHETEVNTLFWLLVTGGPNTEQTSKKEFLRKRSLYSSGGN